MRALQEYAKWNQDIINVAVVKLQAAGIPFDAARALNTNPGNDVRY